MRATDPTFRSVIGTGRVWVVPLLLLTFVGGVANLVAIVGYVVASTSGLPDREQGLATGLVTMSQQVGIVLGTPVMSAVITSQAARGLLSGVRVAVTVNVLLCSAAALLVAVALRLPRAQPRLGADEGPRSYPAYSGESADSV